MVFSMLFKTLTLQETQKVKKVAYELQKAATYIGVERITECIDENYVEELNKEYFAFAISSIIHTMLAHI